MTEDYEDPFDYEYASIDTMKVTRAKPDGFREVTQDVSSHLAWAKLQRELGTPKDSFVHGLKPFCNIPDSVSLDIMTKYGINIHDNQTDRDDFKKVKTIIKRDYPHLMYH